MEKNKIPQAFFVSLLIFTGIHLMILYGFSLYSRDIERVNVFRLLDLQLLFPDIDRGTTSFILSYGLFFLVFVIIYFFLKKHRDSNIKN